MKPLTTLLTILLPILLTAQASSKINKYSLSLGLDFGHSFLSFDQNQNRWTGTFNPSGAMNILFSIRINQKLIADIGIGFRAYGLILRGPVDKYIIDFASPHLSTGLSYNFQTIKGNELYLKLTTGIQLGHKTTFIDEFETYKVTIQGHQRFYQFIRPEIGFRRYFKERMKGSRYKMAYEFGVFFRYSMNTLGTVIIEEADFKTQLKPRGNVLGVYLRVLFPVGRKRLEIKNKPKKELPPKIYSPRYTGSSSFSIIASQTSH